MKYKIKAILAAVLIVVSMAASVVYAYDYDWLLEGSGGLGPGQLTIAFGGDKKAKQEDSFPTIYLLTKSEDTYAIYDKKTAIATSKVITAGGETFTPGNPNYLNYEVTFSVARDRVYYFCVCYRGDTNPLDNTKYSVSFGKTTETLSTSLNVASGSKGTPKTTKIDVEDSSVGFIEKIEYELKNSVAGSVMLLLFRVGVCATVYTLYKTVVIGLFEGSTTIGRLEFKRRIGRWLIGTLLLASFTGLVGLLARIGGAM